MTVHVKFLIADVYKAFMTSKFMSTTIQRTVTYNYPKCKCYSFPTHPSFSQSFDLIFGYPASILGLPPVLASLLGTQAVDLTLLASL